MKRELVAIAVFLVLCGSVRAQGVSPIVHEGIVDAPLDTVWTAWTTSDGLRSWLAPHAEFVSPHRYSRRPPCGAN